jgi:hypothetical protein
MFAPRYTRSKRPYDDDGPGASKRHHSFTGDASSAGVLGESSSIGSVSGLFSGYSGYDPSTARRATSFSPLSTDAFTLPQAGYGSGSTTPASESVRTFSGTGGELASIGNYSVGVGEVQLPPLLFDGAGKPPSQCSVSAPNSGSGTFMFGQPKPSPILPPVSSIDSLPPQPDDSVWGRRNAESLGLQVRSGGNPREQRLRSLRRGALLDIAHCGEEPVPRGNDAPGRPSTSNDFGQDPEPYSASGTSWSTIPAGENRHNYATAAEALADLSRLQVSGRESVSERQSFEGCDRVGAGRGSSVGNGFGNGMHLNHARSVESLPAMSPLPPIHASRMD